jgi:calcium-dependent protein kinase
LSKEISQKYNNIFKAIDINNDGKVTAVELREGFLKSGFSYSQEEVDSIIEGIDRDNNGYIECEEFISASADLKVLLSDNNVKYAFETLDVDGSGFISFEEIGKFIYGEVKKLLMMRILIIIS